MRLMVSPLLLVFGCARPLEQYCTDVRDDQEGQNHVQPFEVWVDSARREVWSSALGTRTIAALDPDTLEVIERVAIADFPLERPTLVTDDAGIVWVGNGAAPALTRYEPTTKRHEAWFPLETVNSMIPRPGGGVYVLGIRDQASALAIVAPDGSPVRSVAAGVARAIISHPQGLLALSRGGTIYSTEDLSEVGTCRLPIDAFFGAVLPDGNVIVTNDAEIGWSDCNGDMRSWTVGVENKAVIPYGDGAIVLDRIGPADPNNGIVRFVNRDGVTDGFVTGKNTGYGMLDTQTGLLWANSEGTDEVMAWDPATGERVSQVRLGTFLDGLAADPESPESYITTGRLSDTIKRVDDGVITAETHDVHWPYSPVIDSARGVVWLFRQTDSVVLKLDANTLAPLSEIPLGFEPNPLLSFSTLAMDTARDRLYFAESNADVVVGIDAETEQEFGRWSLGGPLITDPDVVGETSVQVDELTGIVYIARSHEGRLQRLDPATGELLSTTYEEDPTAPTERKLDSLHVLGELNLVWFGGRSFAADDLTRTGTFLDEVADVYFPVDEDWVVIDRDRTRLQRVRDDGSVVSELTLIPRTLSAMVTRFDRDRERLWFARSYEGRVCGYAVASVTD